MKTKIFLTYVLLMLFIPAGAYKSVLTLENGKVYNILHAGGSGCYLGKRTSDGMLEIQTPTGDASQQFQCVLNTDGTYSFQLVSTGEYLGRSNVANNYYKGAFYQSASADGTTRFAVEKAASWSTNAKIKNVKSAAYLGTDANIAASGVWFDKSGSDGKHYFCILEVTTKEKLYSLIEKASVYESYPVEMSATSSFYDETKQAEMTAKKILALDVYNNAGATVAERNVAFLQLSDAVDVFLESIVLVNMTEKTEKTVRIHSDINPDMCLIKSYKGGTTNDGSDKVTIANLKIVSKDLPKDYDLWSIINMAEGKYILQNKGNGTYLKIYAENDVYTATSFADVDVINRALFDIYIIGSEKYAIKGISDIFLKNETNTDIRMTATASFTTTSIFTFEEIKEVSSVDHPQQETVQVYSSEGILYIRELHDATVQVYNLMGSLVETQRISSGSARFDLKAGTYIIHIQSPGSIRKTVTVVR